MIELNKIYNADCLELMKEIPDKSIDLVLTDPPYGLNYNDGLDHIADAIRYLLMFIKAPTFKPKDTGVPEWLKGLQQQALETSDSSIDDVWAT